MAKSVMWKELTAPELVERAKAGALVVMPVASMEQHGPHMAVGVDDFHKLFLAFAEASSARNKRLVYL